jgi:RimJ/RimL family protein N-acetyltransferase
MMILNTGRLNFSKVSMEDVLSIHALHSLPETDEFNTLGIPATIQVTERLLEEWVAANNALPPRSYIYCLALRDTDEFVGLIALVMGKPAYKTAEVWFKLHVQHWGKGYTTEALKNLLAFGFTELGLHRVEAGCAVENIASARVLEKAGMTREGMKRKKLPIRGEWKDNYFYGMLQEEWEDNFKC